LLKKKKKKRFEVSKEKGKGEDRLQSHQGNAPKLNNRWEKQQVPVLPGKPESRDAKGGEGSPAPCKPMPVERGKGHL